MRSLFVVPIGAVAVTGLLWWFSRDAGSVAARDRAAGVSLDAAPSAAGETQAAAAATTSGAAALNVIRIPACTLSPIQEQTVPSQVDGLVRAVLVRPGQRVGKGEPLARLDDRKLAPQLELLELRANSRTDERIAQAQFAEADAKVKYAEDANRKDPRAVPELDLKTYLAQRERYAQEVEKAKEEQAAARKELDKVRALLDLHRVTADIEGEVVRSFKRPGEAVRQAEPLFALARTDRLRVDGFCKAQHAARLRPGQRVLLEPELQGAEVAELVGHTNTVTDIAAAPGGGLVASAGLDGQVILWDWPAGRRTATLTHPAAVHAVDVATTDGGHVVVTGCEDGKARVWSLSGGEAKLLRELSGHDGPVRCVRVAPDGKSCVTGGEDRRVGLWDVADGQRRRWLHQVGAWKQTAHQGAVTDLRWAGTEVVMSAGTDNVLKVWGLAGDSGNLLATHRGRTGDLHRLGLSPDGSTQLFDHGDEIRLLDRRDGAVTGVVQNWKNVRFQGFATFSPTGALLLSCTSDGLLQLWRTPAAGQPGADALADLAARGGWEVRNYRVPKAADVKCGAFSPDEKTFFTGGTDRGVRAWAVPPRDEWQPREAVLTYVGGEVEQGTELVRVQAETDNARGQRLRPGTFVTLKAPPGN